VTLAVALTAFLVWHHGPRFGPARPDRPARRRSKEEFLDAMGELLDRKGDYGDAFDTVRQRVLREIETELGLPAGTPLRELLDEAERRRPGRGARLGRALWDGMPVRPQSRPAFISALNDLEAAYDEFSQSRPTR
jgi:hypothetical protein